MIKPSSLQPKNGDIVLHCDHALESNDSKSVFKAGTHWLQAEIPFLSPSGERGIAGWLSCCDWCYRSIDGDIERVREITVTGHVIWRDDGSHIAEDFS